MATPTPRLGRFPHHPPSVAGLSHRTTEILALAALLGLNWLVADALPSTFFSYTSLGLFLWSFVLLARLQPRAAILLLPILLTHIATMLSLVAIEAGAYMPEINRMGEAGDASASFAAFTALLLFSAGLIFASIERPLTAFARSDMLDRVVGMLAWPVIIGCAGWGMIAFIDGLRSGFPLIEGIDRFMYRRYMGSQPILLLLDNKYLFSLLLGSIGFSSQRSAFARTCAATVFVAVTILYFLFGDKFFTILTEVSVFLMPFLLQRSGRLTSLVLRGVPVMIGLMSITTAVTLYIYSDYGRRPVDRTLQLLGERIAGQGELWFIASRDYRQFTHWDTQLVARNIDVLSDDVPPKLAFRNGVETYFFIQHYSPAVLAASFRKNQGWIQLTMGYEAMGLVMFGYVGVAILMVIGGAALALCACYLERAILSGFPLSLFLAMWAYLQIYFSLQQASLWTAVAPGQIKRFFLFFVIELVLFAINRAKLRPVLRRPDGLGSYGLRRPERVA